jgi:Icc-related predicted phosphoesterase
MKIVCISDTHDKHNQVSLPEGDVLVHAGDLTMSGKMTETSQAAEWLNKQAEKFKAVIVIAGNHDFVLEHFMKEGREDLVQEKFFKKALYARDAAYGVEGKIFYGSPWQPWFYDWAFNVQRGPAIAKYWDEIPINTDVLITHGPPMGIMDIGFGGEHAGCEDLAKAISRIKPKLHIFGHIHGGYGVKTIAGTTYVNASVVNERYKVVNEPIVIEI